MKTGLCIALAMLLGAGRALAVGPEPESRHGPESGALGTGSTSSQSATPPGSADSPNLPTQGGPTGNEVRSTRPGPEAGAAGVSAAGRRQPEDEKRREPSGDERRMPAQ